MKCPDKQIQTMAECSSEISCNRTLLYTKKLSALIYTKINQCVLAVWRDK